MRSLLFRITVTITVTNRSARLHVETSPGVSCSDDRQRTSIRRGVVDEDGDVGVSTPDPIHGDSTAKTQVTYRFRH